MKQYDKIYVPDEEEGTFLITRERMEDSAPVHVTYATKEESVIVLTIEELREMWEECRDETWQDARPSTKYEKPDRLPGFEGYLTSKGIQL